MICETPCHFTCHFVISFNFTSASRKLLWSALLLGILQCDPKSLHPTSLGFRVEGLGFRVGFGVIWGYIGRLPPNSEKSMEKNMEHEMETITLGCFQLLNSTYYLPGTRSFPKPYSGAIPAADCKGDSG